MNKALQHKIKQKERRAKTMERMDVEKAIEHQGTFSYHHHRLPVQQQCHKTYKRNLIIALYSNANLQII